VSTGLLRLDWQVWGARAWGFHLTGLVLLALTAALLVVLVRRLTGDAELAALAGLLFALHPAHVENAAWIAARPDVLCALLSVLACLAYGRWRERGSGIPLGALLLFEAALLAKEAAATLPFLILGAVLLDRRRRATLSYALRGFLPLFIVAAVHFLVVWPRAAGRPASGPLSEAGASWIGRFADYGSSAVLPAAVEWVEERPRLWLAAAALVVAVLLYGVLRRELRRVPLILGAGFAFAALLVPALLSFQTRYQYLPSAASSVFLAALLLGAGRHVRAVALGVLAIAWGVAGADLWTSYVEAGRASRSLLRGLVEVSRARPGTEIVVVDMPHRVRGAPVFADFGAALRLSEGIDQAVRYAVLVDFARHDAAVQDRSPEPRMERTDDDLQVPLEAPRRFRSGFAWPHPPPDVTQPVDLPAMATAVAARVQFGDPERLRVRLPLRGTAPRTVCLWSRGALITLAHLE
jgi:hypothetical protein